MTKKGNTALTIEQKWDIFRRDNIGENRKDLAKEYDRDISTINTVCADMMGEMIKRYRNNKNKQNELPSDKA